MHKSIAAEAEVAKGRKEFFFACSYFLFFVGEKGFAQIVFTNSFPSFGIPGESPLVSLLFSLALCSGGGSEEEAWRRAVKVCFVTPSSLLGVDGRGNGTCVDRRCCPANIEGGEATNVSIYFGFSHV